MFARRLTIMVLLVTLFAMGFSAVVAQTSGDRPARQGMFSSCNAANGADCLGTRQQTLIR